MRTAASGLLALVVATYQKSKQLDSLSVRSKITLGYLLAVGLPAVGILSGLTVGNRYQQTYNHRLSVIYQAQETLRSLESNIAKTRLAQELGPHVSNSEDFYQATGEMQQRLAEIKQISIDLESSQAQSTVTLIPELRDYRTIINRFSKELELMTASIQSGFFSSGRIERRILLIAKSDLFREYSQFSSRISEVLKGIDSEILAAQLDLARAEKLRSQIIIGSVMTSVVISSLLAAITVQTISRPLESLTKVAEAVSQEGDTDVRAEVLTQDEIGRLAIALNQLIDWVNTYTSDLKTAQLHLIQVEKMSSVGQLVAGVAHEINNPISFIHGNISPVEQYVQELIEIIEAYQRQYATPPQPLQDLLEEIDLSFVQQDLLKTISSMKVGTTRIREIVLSLRNFSRLDEAGSKHVDIHEGIDNTLLLLEHRLNKNCEQSGIEIIKAYGDLPTVECFPGQLNQVFMNLLANAIDAMEPSEKSATQANQHRDRTLSITTRKVEGDRVQIEVADTGSGMTDKVRSRIFDPFFTTKQIGQGTGLGLSISYQIVTEQHGGTMQCASELGKGTKFVVEIPLILNG